MLGLRAVRRADEAHAVADRRATAARRARPGSRDHTVARQAQLVRQPAQRAHEQPQRGTLLLDARRGSRRSLRARRGRAPTRSAPGRITRSRRGRSAAPGRAWRRSWPCAPSRRPNSSSTSAARDLRGQHPLGGEWNVPTFSAREWRSAADAALGANGSCTCTKSNARARADPRSCATRRSAATPAAPRRREREALADRQHLGAALVGEHRRPGRRRSALPRARPSRTSSRESDGATTTTRCPRVHSSSDTRSTYVLTS